VPYRPYVGGLSSPKSQPSKSDCIGSAATKDFATWSHLTHSNVRKSKFMRPGAMRASIIGAWHFGQAGLSITIGETLECCDFDSGMMLPSNWRERKTLCHR